MNKTTKKTDLEYSILTKFRDDPQTTQRNISIELGLSLGKTNYLIKSLFDKGLIKLNNFRTADNKLRYIYVLTPKGVQTRKRLTKSFLKRKSEEFNRLKKEIESIKKRND